MKLKEIVMVLLMGAAPGYGGTLVLQQGANGYTGAQDTMLMSSTPSFNWGNAANFQIGYDSIGGTTYRALLRFDLSSLTGQFTEITSLQLTFRSSVAAAGSGTLGLYEVSAANASWTETGATWATRDGTNAWSGGVGLGTTGYGSVLATANYTSATTTYTFSITDSAVATALVNDFLNGNNEGFLLRQLDESGRNFAFPNNSNDSGQSYRPALTVNYTSVPEPTSVFLWSMGMAGLGLARRRGKFHRETTEN